MNDSVLSHIIRIIVEVVDPDSIILFGSRATETANDYSDYDICILKSDVQERRKLSMQLYQLLWDTDAPVDILIETPDSFQMKKITLTLFIGRLPNRERFSMKNREIVEDWMTRAESDLYRARLSADSRKISQRVSHRLEL